MSVLASTEAEMPPRTARDLEIRKKSGMSPAGSFEEQEQPRAGMDSRITSRS